MKEIPQFQRMMERRYDENFGDIFKLDKIPESLDAFKEDCLRRIEFTLKDTQIKKVRRFCNKEQYRDEKIACFGTCISSNIDVGYCRQETS